jgi:hypothetical protein
MDRQRGLVVAAADNEETLKMPARWEFPQVFAISSVL